MRRSTSLARRTCGDLVTATSLRSRLASSSVLAACSPGPVSVDAPRSRQTMFAHAVSPRTRRRDASARPGHQRKPLFECILICNRGDPAVRAIRTARRLGIKTVAVYSDADADAMHVKLADVAYRLGPAPSAESYLNIDKIVEIVKLSGAQAVHPGWGFLSENATFAQRLADEGIVFIGPPASAIVSMGSKSESKTIMLAAGVPCTPGYHGDNQDPDILAQEADKIGYPVLIKAIMGGGGKGMKIAETAADFRDALDSAQREALKSFGNPVVLIEKYIPISRHVEVQVFCDKHGNAVYLFERDCSVQRRHQKIIEEAPAPGLPAELRRTLGEKAVAAARAVAYEGAGTVEFLLDVRDNSYYFMEMNTRLQVEHPVTEMITHTDLVEWQLEVASGNPLPSNQDELVCDGHAFEARIYAENPRNSFLPDVGRLTHVRTPVESATIRIETGFDAGDEISVHYDPMIAKLVVHGPDRDAALKTLRRALAQYEIVGPSTNIEFLYTLASHPAFVAADVHTGFIPQHFDALFPPRPDNDPATLATAALASFQRDASALRSVGMSQNPWSLLAGRRFVGDRATLTYPLGVDQVTLTLSDDGRAADVHTSSHTYHSVPLRTPAQDTLVDTTLDGETVRATVVRDGDALRVFSTSAAAAGGVVVPVRAPEWLAKLQGREGDAATGSARAPMPCRVVKVFVKEGDVVRAGQPLVAVEAMKTELVLKAPKEATVLKLACKEGDMVPDGKELVIFEASDAIDEAAGTPAQQTLRTASA